MNRWLNLLCSMINVLVVMASLVSCSQGKIENTDLVVYNVELKEDVPFKNVVGPGGLVLIYANYEEYCSCQVDEETLLKANQWFPDAKVVTILAEVDFYSKPNDVTIVGELYTDLESNLSEKYHIPEKGSMLVFDRDGKLLMMLPLVTSNSEVLSAQKLLLQMSLKGA